LIDLLANSTLDTSITL